MASLKRWRQIGQGQFHKWETPGEEFEGTWRGIHDGRFGPLGTPTRRWFSRRVRTTTDRQAVTTPRPKIGEGDGLAVRNSHSANGRYTFAS